MCDIHIFYIKERIIINILDAIRQVGNYSAHPMKEESTGTIVDVEPEEANWTLDVIEDLFEHYYVMPKRAEERRIKLDEKLESIGKPPMKKPLLCTRIKLCSFDKVRHPRENGTIYLTRERFTCFN